MYFESLPKLRPLRPDPLPRKLIASDNGRLGVRQA
jgi:hypothetical protein